jgi:hypothetical protein
MSFIACAEAFKEHSILTVIAGSLLCVAILGLILVIIFACLTPFRKYLKMRYLHKHSWVSDYLIAHFRWRDWWQN